MTKERFEFLRDYKKTCMNSDPETLREGRKYWRLVYDAAIADGDETTRTDAIERLALIVSSMIEKGIEDAS